MFPAQFKNISRVFTILLSLTAITISIPMPNRNKRSQPSADRPQPSEQLPVQLYRTQIGDLYQRAADIHSTTLDAINSMVLPQATMEYWNRTSFLEVPRLLTEDRINQLRREPIAALTSHRSLISEMNFHIMRCQTAGQIGQQSVANGRTLRSWLVQVSEELFNMKTAFNFVQRQQGSNGNDEMMGFSVYFLGFEQSHTLEDYRAYTLLKDNLILMGYLKDLYDSVL